METRHPSVFMSVGWYKVSDLLMNIVEHIKLKSSICPWSSEQMQYQCLQFGFGWPNWSAAAGLHNDGE